MFCGMSAHAAPGGTWTTIEHTAYPTPQNVMAELDGSKVKLAWDGVQWPADGFPEVIDGKTVPTNFTYSIECRVKTTGTDTWSEWWMRTTRNRLDNGTFVSRWEIEDEVESGKTYQYRIRCYSYIQPDNPQDLTNPTRDGYFSEYSDIVTAYKTLDKLEITLSSTSSPSLRGMLALNFSYTYESSREAEGEEPLYFTFKAIEIPDPEPGTVIEQPAVGGKPYARRDGTPLTVKSIDVSSPDQVGWERVDPTNFTLTATSGTVEYPGEIVWYVVDDLKQYYHDNVTIWVQGWAKPETEGGKPRLVLDEAIGELTIDTRTLTAKPTPEQDGILLTWPSIPDAVKYQVWLTYDGEREDRLLGEVTDTTYTDMDVNPAQIYTYKVIALDAAGKDIDWGRVRGYCRLDAFSTKEQSLYNVQPQTPWNGKVDIVVRYHSARDVWDDGVPYFKLIAENYETGEILNVQTLTRAAIKDLGINKEVLDPNGFRLWDGKNIEQRLVWDAGKDLGDTLIERLRLTVDCAGVKPLQEGDPTTAWDGSPAKYKENVRLDTRSPRIRKLGQGTHAYVNLDWFPGATKADLYCNGTLIHTTTDEYTRTKKLDTELNIWGVNELRLVPDKGDTWVGYIAYPAFDFTVSEGNKDGITLTWNTIDDEAVGGYKILRREKGSTTDFDALATVAVDVTTYTDKTAEEATLYEYTVVPQHTWDANIGPVPATKEGYRTLEKIEFVQARQFYPWSTRVAIDIYYKSARQSSTDGEVTYALKAKMADGTEIPIDSKNLTLETIGGMTLNPNDIPFGSKSLPSGATTRLWWNAPADLTVPLSSSVISGITLQLVPTLAEGAPTGAKPAPATVTSAGITVDLRTKRTVSYGEQIPVVWEWWRTDSRVEAHDKNVFYVKPEGSETDESMVWHTPEHSGEGTIEVPENEDLWPSFRLVKREINTDDTDEAQQITLTSEVLFQMPVAVPQNVQATRGNTDALTLTWDAVPYAYKYQIEVTTVNERGATFQRTQHVFDDTQYIDQNAPALGIVGYKVQACFPNNVTSDLSEQVVGWRSIDQVELKGVSTRRPWNGTVDIDLTYKTVRNQFTKLNGTNLPDRKVSITAETARGEAFAVTELMKETLDASSGMIWREQVDGRSPFTLGNADRITWDAPADAPRMHDSNSVITITLQGDEYSEEIKFERTFDLDTRIGVIEVLSSEVNIPIPWSTRWIMPEAAEVGVSDNWYSVRTVLADATDSNNPIEMLNTESPLGEGSVSTWTPNKWGLNTLTLKFSPRDGGNITMEYAVVFNVVPDFKFTATQGNRDSIIVEWNEPRDIHTYSIRRRAAHTNDAFTEVAICTDTTRWADTSAETIVGEFEYTIMPLTDDNEDVWTQFDPVVGYRALDIARPVTIVPAENGTVTADKETAKYGEMVTLTVTPAMGYELEQLRVMDGETPVTVWGEEGEYVFGMPANEVTVTATFKAIDYLVNIISSENGTVTADKQTAHYGETVTLTITPDEGYELESLRVIYDDAIVPVTEGNTFVMRACNAAITATFKMIDYTVTIQPAENGTVTADKATANMGETVTLTVTPDEGYEFDQLTVMNGETKVDVVAAEGNYTFVMPAGNVEITTTYKAIDYDITLVPSVSGTVTADKETAHVGETVTLTITPDNGYELDQIYVMNGETQLTTVSEGEGIHTFVMPAGNVVISVLFKEATGTDVIAPDAVKATTRKVIRNGIVYIIRDGKTYTATGEEVK